MQKLQYIKEWRRIAPLPDAYYEIPDTEMRTDCTCSFDFAPIHKDEFADMVEPEDALHLFDSQEEIFNAQN